MITTDFRNGTQAIYDLEKMLSDNNVKYTVKITKLWKGAFNNMEGYQFEFNVKISIVDSKKVFKDTKAKSKTIKILTNSTYIDYIEDFQNNENDLKDNLQEYFETLYI